METIAIKATDKPVKNEGGEVIGYTRQFRAPKFTGLKTNYIAIDRYGHVVGGAMPTRKMAAGKL